VVVATPFVQAIFGLVASRLDRKVSASAIGLGKFVG
jgi:hypothetical protein